MKLVSSLFTIAVSSLLATQSAQASVTLNLTAGYFTNFSEANTSAGTLFQLVSLGANGVFDSINIADGSVTNLTQWVSGDDAVITASYMNGSDGFSTVAAFDHTAGIDTPGLLMRSWQIDIPEGTKFGVRWFPGLQALDFATTVLSFNQQYGQFTRQDDPLITGPLYDGVKNGGSLWVAPASGTITLDNLVTTSAGGTENNDLGRAVYMAVPEPAIWTSVAMGAVSLLGMRRRRK